jgi:hypothetical protein
MALTAKKVYAILKRQISDMEAKIKTPIIYRGTVATADLLPLNPDIGDMYNIESKSVYGEAGMNVAWNGVVWDTMGAPIDMSLYIKSSELADWVKQQNKPTYTAEEVGALPADTKIPSKTSDLQNDSGFLTEIPDNYLSGTDKTLNVSGKAADAKATGDKITELSSDISNKLNKNQGSENSGKIAGINESGDIVPMFPVSVDYNEETNCLEFGSDQKMELNKGINLDSTLTKTGYAADAGVVGELTTSLKEDIGYVTETIYGDNFLKTLETVKTELYHAKHTWFIPLNLYSQGDTMLFYFPTLSDGSYQTYLCDESKTAVQDINVVVKEHYSTVVYPKFGKQYAYLRMYAKKSSDVCYIKKMSLTILSVIDGFTQKNIHSLLVDNTGNTDVSRDVQMLINKLEVDDVEIYFPKGKYLFSNTINHKKGNITFRCADGVEMIINSSPVYTTFNISGADIPPYSLGTFKIIGGHWTTTRPFDVSGDSISTGFQLTKMGGVTIINATFDELMQSNHLFDISGTKNILIQGCTFRGTFFNPSQKPNRDGNFEMIQIDLASGINLSICTENGHNECTKNVVIKDCVFESSGKDNCYLYRPVGIHFGGTLINNVVDWYDNIKIENNIFHNVLGRAIEVSCARNVSVKGNIFKQETEIIDGIIKCGSVRWGNTATWATFSGISDKQRYNCMNISILDNMLSCSVDSDEMFIDAFPVLDTSSMYVNSSGSPLTKMAKNVTIKGNTGDLNIRANNIHMLNINNNDVPNVYVDNNS